MDTGKQPMWKSMRDAGASPDMIRQRFRADEAPIAVGRIATGLGIELAEGDTNTYAGHLALQPERAWLWTPTDNAKEVRRYTLAYLIGHVLRMPFGDYRLPPGYERSSDDSEVATFARELLMPRELLERLLKEDLDDETSMAKRLGVLAVHLRRRIQELGLPMPQSDERTQQNVESGAPFEAPFAGEDEMRTEVGGRLPFEDKTDPAGRADRRIFERVNARFEVRFSLPGQAANALLAYSKDISVGGLCLKTSRAHDIGDLLELDMVVAQETYHLRAQVAWTRSGFIGARFVEVSSEDQARLAKLLKALRR
jgi:hypothetical protein